MSKKMSVLMMIVWLAVLTIHSQTTSEKKVILLTTQSKGALDFYRKAIYAWQQADEKGAVENFSKAIQADPGFVMARAFYSMFLNDPENQRMIDEAKKYFARASEGERLFTLAQEAGLGNNNIRKIKMFEDIVARYPDDGVMHFELALLYQGANEIAKAIQEYEQVVACEPQNAAAYNYMGGCYIILEKFAEAKKCLEKYVQLLPQEANAWDSLGDIHKIMGNYSAAWEFYQKAHELKPDFTINIIHLGDVKQELGFYLEAIPYYQEALNTLLPEKAISESHFRMADAFWRLRLASSYLSLGKIAEAEKEIQTIIQHNTNSNVPGHHLAVEIALKKGDIGKAKKEILLTEKSERERNLFNLDKDQIVNFSRARVALAENDLVSAEKSVLDAINAFPTEGRAGILRWVYFQGNDRHICLEPLNLLVEIKKKQGRVEEEIQAIKRSLRLIGHQPQLYFRLAEIYAGQNKKDEAAKEFTEFLSLALEFNCAERDVLQAAKFMAKYEGYKTLTGAELLEKIKPTGAQKIVLMDCRPENEFREGHIPGAANVSMDSFTFGQDAILKSSLEKIIQRVGRKIDFVLKDGLSGDEYMSRSKLEELLRLLPQDRDQEIIFYCRKPACTRSPLAARWAVALGYRNVWRFLGGWKEWAEKGYPAEK